MKIFKEKDLEIIVFKPNVFSDSRGFFLETSRESILKDHGIPPLVQHNQSRSEKGVLRGLHYQLEPLQGKLVRCSYGKIFDVAVDIRISSPSFGKSFYIILDDILHEQIWIPAGFAHGFYVLSDYADVCYQSSEYYNPNMQKGIAWNDSELNIEWPIDLEVNKVIISEKDKENVYLRDISKKDLPY